MTHIAWDPSYGVGIPILDAQHQKLFNLLSALHEQLARGAGPAAVGNTIAEALAAMYAHFREEERLMQASGYPGLAEHKAIHASFADRMRAMQNEFNAGRALLDAGVIAGLQEWFSGHILGVDASYAPHLRANLR